jgi:rfaE bifunctional protein nucleotidyltransferase chain/domain
MDETRQFMPTNRKITDLDTAKRRVAAWRENKKAVAYTNGCFDLLHLGHVRTLESARRQADVLVVGINGDESVRQLKGPGRPVVPEQERAEMVAALECVDLVVVFQELSSLAVIQALQPEVWVKGGDYRIDTVNQEERAYVESYGGRVVLGEHVPHASSSDLISRIKRLV